MELSPVRLSWTLPLPGLLAVRLTLSQHRRSFRGSARALCSRHSRSVWLLHGTSLLSLRETQPHSAHSSQLLLLHSSHTMTLETACAQHYQEVSPASSATLFAFPCRRYTNAARDGYPQTYPFGCLPTVFFKRVLGPSCPPRSRLAHTRH